jgi:hypothetical protein
MTNKDFYKQMWGDISESLLDKEEPQPVITEFTNLKEKKEIQMPELHEKSPVSFAQELGDTAYDDLKGLLDER